ncbi:hypothetical protein T01_8637 [Trichinella spiralis]|uniref:Uncharacterized protein n=1 Tax=Trichinella spiralis TaxID=6334 RepID=A0A0V1BW95_TRISP|nr:hypothetical protein T01_8637 [Trichinella spiralis]
MKLTAISLPDSVMLNAPNSNVTKQLSFNVMLCAYCLDEANTEILTSFVLINERHQSESIDHCLEFSFFSFIKYVIR